MNLPPLAIGLLTLLTLAVAPTPAPAAPPTPPAEAPAKPVHDPPFLITKGLPHLVGLVKQRWDDPKLALTPAQKDQLVASRERTVAAVERLSAAIAPLQAKVIAGSRDGAAPESLRATVDEIARLKAEATMVHLRCLHETAAILDDAQMALLLAR
ncbi:MAG: hypothetical protein EP329_02905 [Deltaproteobacteria bacterium]|nr:MAG: hypothetical protein EP329_02905 [Deltaproteobacteria bacterium]